MTLLLFFSQKQILPYFTTFLLVIALSACQKKEPVSGKINSTTTQVISKTPISPQKYPKIKEKESPELQKQRRYYAHLATIADKGDTEAQLELGMRYFMGNELKQDTDKALFWLTKSATASNTLAQYSLANILMTGQALPAQPQQAIIWMTKAADAGLSEAQRDLGAWFLSDINHPTHQEKARFYLEKSAHQGDADAQYILGEILLNKASTDAEKQTAKTYFEKAAAQEHPRAKQRLERW